MSGFRLDGIGNLYEDAALRDEPVLPGLNALGDPNLSHIYTRTCPRRMTHTACCARWRTNSRTRCWWDRCGANSAAELAAAYGAANDELQLPINARFGSAGALVRGRVPCARCSMPRPR